MDIYKINTFLQAIDEGHNTTTGILNRTGIFSLSYNLTQLKKLDLVDTKWTGNKQTFTLTKRGQELRKTLQYLNQNP